MIVVTGGLNLKIVMAKCIMVGNTENQTLLLRVFFLFSNHSLSLSSGFIFSLNYGKI